ncbi:hypothetical protein [Paraburkholderia lacunae]|uniref:hypothetical protein n=1 Tax=Paraburkholderia lacunae TaxID=2211104 RepID=UPI0010590EDA|nr:hypothetical protein [Paraburkholderia lacunae]
MLPLLLLFLSAPRPALAASEDWQVEAGIATDKVTRGMDISYHQPSESLAGSWYPGNGFFAGASAASIRWGDPMTTGAGFVVNAGYGWRLSGDWTAQAMLSHYQFTRAPSASRFNYDELVLTAGWRDSVFASPATPLLGGGRTGSPAGHTGRYPGRMLLSGNFTSQVSGLPSDVRFDAATGDGSSLPAEFSSGATSCVHSAQPAPLQPISSILTRPGVPVAMRAGHGRSRASPVRRAQSCRS